QGVLASQLGPPGIPGHDPSLIAKNAYDPSAARALLDKFGYKDRDGDGYRELPDGKPLTIVKAGTPEALDRTANELWKKNMNTIGIRLTLFTQKWPELHKMSEAGPPQLWGLSCLVPVPEPVAFARRLSSKPSGPQ